MLTPARVVLAILAIVAGKRLVDDRASMPLEAAIGFERDTVSMLFAPDDRAEGLKAFRERREPRFTGQ